MRRKGKIWFLVLAFLILFLAFTTFFGVETRYGDIVTERVKPASEIRFGIDISGGVEVVFVPATEVEATAAQMDAAQAVVEQRLITMGVTDYELYKDAGNGRMILRFPWRADETEFDPEATIQELSVAAVLTFREGGEMDETTGAPSGVTAENVVLEGSDIASAVAQFGPASAGGANEYYVLLSLNESGVAKFSQATARLAAESGSISIWMDNTMISNPSVNQAITDDTAVITGEFTAESAKQLADRINSGALPFALQAESYSTISPTLGSESLRAMVLAGIVAFVLVAGFMVFTYRLPGFAASLSLLGQTAATVALVSRYFPVFPSATLTLPGIAGIILAIGMGVDANVITAERIKEELRGGKKLDAALREGFHRGFPTILDSNVTVLIVAVILMGAFGPPDSVFAWILSPFFRWFGTAMAGTIYSFGYTLLCGVLLNFVFGVGATRVLLTALSKFRGLRKAWLYSGLKTGQTAPVEKPFRIVQRRRQLFALSLLFVAVIAAASFGMGVRMDVQFRGGAIISYSYAGSVDMQAVQTAVEETLGAQATMQTGMSSSRNALTVTMPGSDTVSVEKLEELTARLTEEYPTNAFEQLEVSNVEPSMGRTLLLKSVTAVVLASLLILAYVAVRFRKIGGWRGGVTAVAALVHDLIIVFGVYVLLGIPLSSNFIAALLTILGYSINDTVVIYDRVRENRGLYGKRRTFAELVNLSINQSLRRSVNTTMTTLLALGCVCIFSVVYGLDSILTFAFPLMVGMISGVYSTVCIAGPLWVSWETRLENKHLAARRKTPESLAGGKPKADVPAEKAEKEDAKKATVAGEKKPAVQEKKADIPEGKEDAKKAAVADGKKPAAGEKKADVPAEKPEEHGEPDEKAAEPAVKTGRAKKATAEKDEEADAEDTKGQMPQKGETADGKERPPLKADAGGEKEARKKKDGAAPKKVPVPAAKVAEDAREETAASDAEEAKPPSRPVAEKADEPQKKQRGKKRPE